LVRELTDGVVHFLAAESDGETPTTGQVAEVVVKVVRELGRPDLAEAFAAHGRRRVRRPGSPAAPPAAPAELVLRLAADTPPGEVARRCLEQYSLQAVFGRDLAAAHADGLLTLTDLEIPGELAGCVLSRLTPAAGNGGLIEALEEVRRRA